ERNPLWSELRSEYLLLRLVPFHCLLRRRKFARVSALQRYPTVFPLPVLFAGAWKDPVPVHRLLHPPVGCNRLKVPRFPKELNVLIEQRVPLQNKRVPLFNVRSGQQLPSETLARNVLRLLQPPEHSRTLLLSESLHPVRELLPHSGVVPKALLRLLRLLLLLLCHHRPLTSSAVCLPSTDKYMGQPQRKIRGKRKCLPGIAEHEQGQRPAAGGAAGLWPASDGGYQSTQKRCFWRCQKTLGI